MMRVFIDTNVFIDFLAHRDKFYEPAAIIVSLARNRKIDLLVSALSFATASYILQSHHHHDHDEMVSEFENFIDLCKVTTVGYDTVRQSVRSAFIDFEDAMQHYSALAASADYIITRNKQDFLGSEVPVYSPQEFLNMLVN